MTNIRAVNTINKYWFRWKTWATLSMKKLFVIVISNNTPETITKQQWVQIDKSINVEVNVVTKFIKDEVESSSNIMVDVDF